MGPIAVYPATGDDARPALRGDLKLAPNDNVVRFYEPSGQRFVQLWPLETHIAQLMDGQRTINELVELARVFNATVTRAVVEKLVDELFRAGLLVTPKARERLSGEIKWTDDDHNAATVLERASILGESDVFASSPPPPPGPNLRVVPSPASIDDDTPNTILQVIDDDDDWPEPIAPAAATSAAAAAAAAAAPDDDDWPEPEQPAALPTAQPVAAPSQIAAQEQEELWKHAHGRRWYHRTSLRVLAVLVIIVAAAAVIPYPLRVTSDCTLVPSERVEVRSALKGVLAEILVDEGAIVKKGDVIARLDDRALKAERVKKLAEIDKFEAELAVLRQGHRPEEIQQQDAIVAARRNEAAFAAKEAARRSQMVKEGVGSRQAADDALRDAQTKNRAVAETEAALHLLQSGSRPEEIAAQEAVEKGAKAELAYIDERLAMSVVRAPIDGSVLTARFREHVNQSVEAGGLVCEIANTKQMRAEILMPERDVDVIKLGMPATIKVESYPTHPFEGKVDFIAPSVEAENKRVRIVVALDNVDGMLKSNMSGYGEVEVGKRSLLTLATRRVTRWIRVRFLI